ncbi:hypothetical protein [Yinghuangia seranimata]|uniref:hypothetical protein n=1 Tax=Yinghuangia seranimata TaxID=408067 RepID=UPI00248B84BB|nr:hypothetical protein [Yinghuangia seranimata]MDI2129695.1 hypothetical protein [Yinghuangia seranimata]
MPETDASRTPVTAADVEYAVSLANAAFRRAPADASWDALAGPLTWTCWETAEHLIDDLFFYAAQIAPAKPWTNTYIPFTYDQKSPEGPHNSLWADREAGVDGLLHLLEVGAGMLAAVVTVKPATVRGFHSYGVADPEGFAAMGVIETLVHADDICKGLGIEFTPPVDLCDRVMARLFPDAPADTHRWQTMLWATGRAELPGHGRREGKWRWHSAPLGEESVEA